MFPKWAKDNTKIARFMQHFDPKKIYTEKEMKEYTLIHGICNIGQLLSINVGSHGFGTIIQRTKSSYRLYPELITAYNKNFNYQYV